MARLIARIIVFVLWGIRLIAPWAFRFAWYCLMLAVTSLIAMWRGFPQTIQTMADEWIGRAIRAGFPTAYVRQLRTVLWIVAVITVIAGWVILSHITVWFWRVIF